MSPFPAASVSASAMASVSASLSSTMFTQCV